MGATTTAVRAAGALVLLSLLAGCTGGDGIVTTTPSPTLEASDPTPSPTATPSDDGELSDEELLALMPEGAADPGVLGAQAFAQFWATELGASYGTGDTRTIRTLATADCSYCETQISLVESQWRDGGSIVGGEFEVDPAAIVVEARDDGFTYAQVTAVAAELTFVGADGATDTYPSEVLTFELQMAFNAGHWWVNGVYVGPDEA